MSLTSLSLPLLAACLIYGGRGMVAMLTEDMWLIHEDQRDMAFAHIIHLLNPVAALLLTLWCARC